MELQQIGNGTSYAKIILLGEHSVVYGKPAIALPLKTITANTVISSLPNQDILLESNYFTGNLSSSPKQMLGIKNLITYLVENLNISSGIKIKLKSNLPAERGMGSSAAISISIIRAFHNFVNKPLTKAKLLKLANIAEKITHKNPSGLDAATSSSENPIWMIRDVETTDIPVNMYGYLLISDSGLAGQTSEAIKIVQENLKNNPTQTNELLNNLGNLTFTAKDQLATNNLVGLGKTFKKAHVNLKKLGVSISKLDNLIAIAEENGSLGSKLTGGGRGGCFISLVKTRDEANELANILQANGVTENWIEPLFKEEL
ncbi:mevalonate kinase [Ligilactobacillus hayakitensis DSM 18933 = JCM 14209]|uniref:Mevalonate kinase n=1 Tax=Ligilactobacillus hayakitensis DSM 18933 = JCM 14209 TaxID=1423755 RepID=A0A0R1WLY7_9LACO|nr:mevalonate kinase [Ligilactobacillus hayakitensis]KRM18896.1 mevalonate kinase [Ligilactobacillus hayakitensis DSM 18933 = JCM 14209]